MVDLRGEEYRALRATIRERGTVRAVTFLLTIVAWAALLLLYAATGPRTIIGSLLSLMVLAAGFEVIYQIHLGVERVGRYLQVNYEEGRAADASSLPGATGWETTAMAYGRAYRTAGSDPLFSGMFVLATLLNLLPVMQAWRVPTAAALLVATHLIFLLRVRIARAFAGVQRAQDLARFRELKAGAATSASEAPPPLPQ